MTKYELYIDGNKKDFISLEYSKSLEYSPQSFSVELAEIDESIGYESVVEIYRNGQLDFKGYVLLESKELSASGEGYRITGKDHTWRYLRKTIGRDEAIGSEPADLVRAILVPNLGIHQPYTITDENVGTGDGIQVTFYLDYSPVKEGSEKIYLDGNLQTKETDYTINYSTGEITFTSPPSSGSVITADYSFFWKITASGEISSNPKEAVRDRNLFTSWWTGDTQKAGDYIQIDLQIPHKVCRVVIEHEAEYYIENYQIKVSTNGTTWTTVASGTNSLQHIDKTWDGIDNVRYIRVECTANSSRDWKVREIYVYYQYQDRLLDEGQIDELGMMLLASWGNYENRLMKLYRIAELIGWYCWIEPSTTGLDKVYFKSSRGTDKTSTVVFKTGKNIRVLDYQIDVYDRCDQLTLLGSGDGWNQLAYTVKVSPLPSDPREIVIVESDIVDLYTLIKRAEVLLDEMKNPKEKLRCEVLDLGLDFDVGDKVRVLYPERNIDKSLTVHTIRYRYSATEGEEIEVELGNRRERLESLISNIEASIERLVRYYGGYPTLFQFHIRDNLDSTHPIHTRIKIPLEARIIQYVKMDVYGQPFRAYSKAILGGGGTTRTTTEEASHKHEVLITGATSDTFIDSHKHDISIYSQDLPYDWGPYQIHLVRDLLGNYVFWINLSSGFWVSTTDAGGSSHSHNINIPATTSEEGSPHSHQVSIPDHTHSIDFGIYEDTPPSNAKLKIVKPSGHQVILDLGSGEFQKEDWDLTSVFDERGYYDIYFMSDSLGRIEANIYVYLYLGIRVEED